MKTYMIRVNCGAYKDIQVEADNIVEASKQAVKIAGQTCGGGCAEFGEVLAEVSN